jgi:hypothetical protein
MSQASSMDDYHRIGHPGVHDIGQESWKAIPQEDLS